MGLPGYWAVLFVRAVMQHPAGHGLSLPVVSKKLPTLISFMIPVGWAS